MKKIEGEKWKTITFHKSAYGKHYAISNHGRLCAFDKKPDDGTLLNGSLQEGYAIWRFKKRNKNGEIKNFGILLHRLVAQYFLPPKQKGEKVVMHFNYKKTDNNFSNLGWATIAEASAHAQGSPNVKKAKKLAALNGNVGNTKLNVAKVKEIKAMLAKGKTLKEIALKFKVSDMQIYRIKIGENWKQVK
jgi:HNH endonuclease/Helix-turn-helix domain of resolvase